MKVEATKTQKGGWKILGVIPDSMPVEWFLNLFYLFNYTLIKINICKSLKDLNYKRENVFLKLKTSFFICVFF